MKHDKMKKQRANVVVPLTAVGRQQMRRAGRSGSEVAGQWGWGGNHTAASPSCQS